MRRTDPFPVWQLALSLAPFGRCATPSTSTRWHACMRRTGMHACMRRTGPLTCPIWQVRHAFDEHSMQAIFTSADADGNGVLSYAEAAAAVRQLQTACGREVPSRAPYCPAWQLTDPHTCLIRQVISDEAMPSTIAHIDADGDGEVTTM